MKFEVAPKELQKSLAYLLPVISKQVGDVLFLNVLLEAAGGELRLRATDTIITANVKMTAKVEAPGSLGVNAERLHKIISNAADADSVRLERRDVALELRAKRSKSKLPAVEASQFPPWPKPTAPGVVLDAKKTLACLRRIKHTMLDDPNRPALSGVRLIVEQQNYLVVSCTDARRLSRAGALIGDAKSNLFIFLPTRAALLLAKLCEWTKDGPIYLSAAGREVFFWNDGGLGYSTKLLSSTGIDPDGIRPKGSPKTMATFDRLKMLAALARICAIEEREIRFSWSGKTITMYAQNTDGEAEEIIGASLQGAEASVRLGASYVTDALSSMKSKDVYLYVWDLHMPLMLVPAEDEDTFELLMPMSNN